MRGGGGSPRNTYGGHCTEQRLLFTPGSPWPVVADAPSLPPVSLVPPPKDPPPVPYEAAPSSRAILVPQPPPLPRSLLPSPQPPASARARFEQRCHATFTGFLLLI
jgi:hypothetical protein